MAEFGFFFQENPLYKSQHPFTLLPSHKISSPKKIKLKKKLKQENKNLIGSCKTSLGSSLAIFTIFFPHLW